MPQATHTRIEAFSLFHPHLRMGREFNILWNRADAQEILQITANRANFVGFETICWISRPLGRLKNFAPWRLSVGVGVGLGVELVWVLGAHTCKNFNNFKNHEFVLGFPGADSLFSVKIILKKCYQYINYAASSKVIVYFCPAKGLSSHKSINFFMQI